MWIEWIALLVMVVIVALSLVVAWHLRRAQHLDQQVGQLLQLRIPRENTRGPAAMQRALTALHGLEASYRLWDFVRARPRPRMSLELISQQGELQFCVWVPRAFRQQVERQLHAQYPDLELSLVADYAPSRLPSGVGLAMAEITLDAPDMYPIRGHGSPASAHGEAQEPLAALTAALGALAKPEDQAWMQLVIAPAPRRWYRRARRRLQKRQHAGDGVAEQGAKHKLGQLIYRVTGRLVHLGSLNRRRAQCPLEVLTGGLAFFTVPGSNRLVASKVAVPTRHLLHRYRRRLGGSRFHLSVEELATLFHPPVRILGTEGICWADHRRLEPPAKLPRVSSAGNVTGLGRVDFRGRAYRFGLRPRDRLRHLYLIGKTGMGKSALLHNMIHSDILAGRGVGLLDPHGDLVQDVLGGIPAHRSNDVVLLNPADTAFPFALNLVEVSQDPDRRSRIASGLVAVFKKLYGHSWGPRLEHLLRQSLLTLTQHPGASLLGVPRLLADPEYRRRVVSGIHDPILQAFWREEFEKMHERLRVEAIAPIQNKVGQFLASHLIRNIVGQPRSTVDLRFGMDSGKIILADLSKGKLGEDSSMLLGSMLLSKFQLEVMARAEVEPDQRRPFYLYVDEFQNFATEAFGTILSEARKYGLGLTLAHQYVRQMGEPVRDAVLGNVGSMLSFQVGYEDAQLLARQFAGVMEPEDLVRLPKYHAYARLLVDGEPTPVFSLKTLAPPQADQTVDRTQRILRYSRQRYGRPRQQVEARIRRWAQGR